MITNKMTDGFKKCEGGLFSKTLKADVGDEVSKLEELGVKNFAWADPFYPAPSVPSHVADAMIKSIQSGFASHYTMPIGNQLLKEEVCKKLLRVNGIEADPDRNVIITPGSDSGLFFSMLPFINKGDEVLIIDPSYPNNYQNTELLGGTAISVPVYEEDSYQFNIDEFYKRVTDKTKMIVLTNPNNPTTTVYSKENLLKLAKFAKEYDLVVIVDQAFEEPCFDENEMVTFASLPDMFERTVTVFSLSKGLGLSGLRVGYILASDQIIDKMIGSVVSVLGATNTSAQMGAIAALQNPDFSKQYFESFDKRRKLVYKYLHDINGISMSISQSGFLSWINTSKLGTSSEIVAYLQKEAGVTVNSGEPYGKQGEGHIRIVHGVLSDEKELEDTLIKIRKSLIKLAKEKI